MNEFSFSRLEKFTCPARWYRHYVLEVPEPPTEPLVLGKVCHSVIQLAALNRRIDEDFFRQVARVVAENAPLPVDPEEVFALTYQPLVLKEIEAGGNVEDHLVYPINGEVFSPMLQGHIDLWRQGEQVVLIDWKTNHKTYSPNDTMQLKLYAWLLSQKTGAKQVHAQLVFLRFREVKEAVIGPYGIEEGRAWAEGKINEIVDRLIKIEQGAPFHEVFPAVPGDTCSYCGWASECVNGELPSIPGEVKTVDQAEALGAEILRLEAAVKQMKDLLKGYVKLAGPIIVGSQQFCEVPSVSWNFNKEAMKAAIGHIAQAGKSFYHYITLNSTALKKLGWSDAFIASLGAEKRVTNRFTHVGVK